MQFYEVFLGFCTFHQSLQGVLTPERFKNHQSKTLGKRVKRFLSVEKRFSFNLQPFSSPHSFFSPSRKWNERKILKSIRKGGRTKGCSGQPSFAPEFLPPARVGAGAQPLSICWAQTAKGQGAAKARRGGASMGMRLLGRQGQFKGAWTRPSVRNIYNSLKYISYDFTKS